MPTNETKYVTEQILTYYDSKLKAYIDEKAIQPHNELERRVDEVEITTAVNSANIQSHREELDDLEAAVAVLQQDNKDMAQDIADLRVAVENISGGATSDVTKEYVDSRIEEAIESLQIPDTDNFVTKDEFDSVLEDLPTSDDIRQLNESVANVEVSLEEKANRDEIPSLEGLATEQFVIDRVSEIDIPETDLSNYYTKDEVDAKIPTDYLKETDLEGLATETYVKVVASTNKYEVLPLEGMFVQYNDNEVRINTEHVDMSNVPPQNAGDGSSDSLYYVTFRAYAPEGATSVIEGSSDNMDSEHSTLATDQYGRQYTTIWSAIASKSGSVWSKFGDKSTVDKYLGFYYNFWWYNGDKLISKEKVRVILTNDTCHNDLVPDAIARRIDDKVGTVATTVDNISETIENIENTYVQNETLENYVTNEYIQSQNFVTNNYIEQNYSTTEQIAATYVTEEKVNEVVTNEVNTVVTEQIENKVAEVIQEKVDAGEIQANSIAYGTF